MLSFDWVSIQVLIILIFASYVQSITGFAFGLIAMASIVACDLIPIEIAAFVISVLSMLNAVANLRKGRWRNINRRAFTWIFCCSSPAIAVGLWLLGVSGGSGRALLQGGLGICLIGSSLIMMYRVTQLTKPSSITVLSASGVLAGLMGGLFSTSGPPITFVMYRQPFSISTIRSTLLCLLCVGAALRICIVALSDTVSATTIGLSAIGAPAVMLGVELARRFPPPISDAALRRMAFTLLLLSGVFLTVKGFI